MRTSFYFRSNHYDDFMNCVVIVVIVGWALAHQQTIVRYFGGLKPTLRLG